MQFKQFNRPSFKYSQQKGMVSSASTKCIPFSKQANELVVRKAFIKVPSGETQKQTQIYEWRLKTEFPIAKINHFLLKSSSQQKSTFIVELEPYQVRLSNLQELPLFKIIYLLKESLIGFQRLFNLYGPFQATPNMIALNSRNKCKVWLNQNYASNQIICSGVDQKEFLFQLYEMFEVRSNRLKTCQTFFQEIKQFKTFFSALNFIEKYVKTNKLNVLTICVISQKEMVSSVKKFNPTLTIDKLPIKTNGLLRASLQNKASQLISNTSNEEQEQASLKMKKSQETAAQILDQKSSGLKSQDYFFIHNTLFKDQPSSELLARSHLQPQFQSKASFSRKFSGQYPSIKGCLSPPRPIVNFTSPKKVPKAKWNENAFTTCQMEQAKQPNLFVQNKWQKTLHGLFSSQQSLKKSVHEGKQQRAAQMCPRFDLLDSFGKTIQESHVHEEMDSFQI